jgi:hypothetical protein
VELALEERVVHKLLAVVPEFVRHMSGQPEQLAMEQMCQLVQVSAQVAVEVVISEEAQVATALAEEEAHLTQIPPIPLLLFTLRDLIVVLQAQVLIPVPMAR